MEFNKEYFEDRKIEPKHLLDMGRWIFDLNINGKILDAGCGAAGHRVYNGRELYNREVCGIDISTEIRNNPYGYDENILREASILNIPTQENEFELVICYDVLEHLNNIEEVETALKELKRVSNKYVLLSVPYFGICDLEQDKTHKIKKTKEWWISKFNKFIGNSLILPSNWLFKDKTFLYEVTK